MHPTALGPEGITVLGGVEMGKKQETAGATEGYEVPCGLRGAALIGARGWGGRLFKSWQ